VLCAYSIHDTDPSTYAKEGAGGKWTATGQRATDKANPWFNEKHPDSSRRLKEIKDKINENFAHGNIMQPMFSMVRNDDDVIEQSLFDVNTKPEGLRYELWLLSTVAIAVMLAVDAELPDNDPPLNHPKGLRDRLLDMYRENEEMGARMFEDLKSTKD
jgi:hypothetical protein